MDFNDTPQEAAFRAEVKAWLAEHAAEYAHKPATPWSEQEFVARARAWQAKKAAAGYAGIRQPVAVGGRGGTDMEAIIFEIEEAKYHVPVGPVVSIGQNMVLTVIHKHGTEEQQKKFIDPTIKGELLWCQLFSEPGAGSDLAAVRTRAVRDGDHWILNGQKVWSSWAHHSDWGILIARSDPSVVKHKGLTFFVVDMKTPGIDVRPIRQISGESDFNETFLTDVRIPDSCRIGAVGEGWACAMTVLSSERLGSGGLEDVDSIKRLIGLAKATPSDQGSALDNAAIRERIAQLHAMEQGQMNFHYRLLTRISKGEMVGAEASTIKYAYAQRLQQIGGFAMEIQGLAGTVIDGDAAATAGFHADYIWSSAMRIAGGADEVILNQIAERVLGMPGEIRGDKNVPFDQLK